MPFATLVHVSQTGGSYLTVWELAETLTDRVMWPRRPTVWTGRVWTVGFDGRTYSPAPR